MAKKRKSSPAAIATTIVVAIVIALISSAGFYTDFLWFDQLGFSEVFTTSIKAQVAAFAVAGVTMAFFTWLSLYLAYRTRPIYAQIADDRPGFAQYRELLTGVRKGVTVGLPLLLGVFAGIAADSFWPTALTFLNREPAGVTDPQFGLDVTFYMFDLPFYRGLDSFFSIVALICLVIAVVFHLVFGGIRSGSGQMRFTRAARVQVGVSAAVFAALQGVSIWLTQFDTMTSSAGLFTGASYADVNARIPGFQIMAGIALVVAALFLVSAFIGRWRLPIMATALMLVSSLVVGGIYPWIVQSFQVVPNERTLESEFIKRNIDATRTAFGLDIVKVVDYAATTTAEPGALKEDATTTAQIRIIDPGLVSASFKQLEQYRQYYNFNSHLDVDRYLLDGKYQDTVIAARELNQSGLGDSQSWYNNTIVYTHGYGLVAAYGNQRSADGQPVFFQSGIPSTGLLGDYEPRIYFGETSPEYSIVGGTDKALELDYPAGEGDDQQTYTTFKGDGGPKLSSIVNRLAYALKFQSEQILLSDAINNDSQILYNRNPQERVAQVAPYLNLDSDTYPAVVDGRIVWIVDGYTTSDAYPYSRAENFADAISDSSTGSLFSRADINYIRNSVKATVDAYDGKVTLYAWDTTDPILKAWMKVFPNTIKPVSEMSGDLISHVRYPADMFKVQRSILGSYHVTEAGAFYSQQDAWMTPNDPTTSTNAVQALQPPYYLSLQTPDQKAPAFSIYSTFIPRSTGEASRNVLTGYFVADSDAGSQKGTKASSYGELRLLVLPRDTVVPGPGQVQNNFNSDSDVSKLLNILRQGSTKVLNGNLLTLPVGGGLLYVQPVYIQSTGETSFPLLKKVLVAFGDKIAFEDTLDAALDRLFGGNSGASAGDGTGTDGGNTDGGNTDGGTNANTGNADLDQALADAAQALRDKDAALRAGDLAAFAKADAALTAAINAAIKASE
jgi:hypothetical protein